MMSLRFRMSYKCRCVPWWVWLWPRGCALSGQPVADAVDVGDPALTVATELAAEAAGVAVERAGSAGRRVSPEVGQELYSEEVTRMKRERRDAEAIMARLTIRHEALAEFVAL